MIRDIAFLVILLAVLIITLVLYSKLSSVLNSARRTLKGTEEIVSAVSKLARPAAAGTGTAFGVGKVAAFLFGLSRRKKNRRGDDGE